MSNEHSLPALLSTLRDSLKVQSALLSKIEQGNSRVQSAFDQRMHSLHADLSQLNRRVDSIVSEAGSRVAHEAKDAFAPVAAQYEREVSKTSSQLDRANRTIWIWFAAMGTTILLALSATWTIFGYYQRELRSSKEALESYENAIPVLRAFYASDVTVCGERVCVNVDPSSARTGSHRQYRQARPRPQQ